MTNSIDITLNPEHHFAIKALAEETHRPVDEVGRLYFEKFELLDTNARIKDYLIVLTCKKVRDEMRKQAQFGEKI